MAFKCTRGSLERLCSAFRDHMSNRNYSRNLELKSFLLSYYHINEAENSGVQIPAEIRWLGGAKVRARFQEKKEGASSVVAAVLGEATFNRPQVFHLFR